MEIDLTQSLKDTENSLRDFIGAILEKDLGADWMTKCGVTDDRLKQWQENGRPLRKNGKGAVWWSQD